jgi:hypothetical protein
MLGELSKHMDTLIISFLLFAAICFIIWVNRK